VTSEPPEHEPERRASPTILVPWPNLGWVLSLSIVFAGNVTMSTFAWFAVEMVVR
jgi:hypothetical protein